MDGGTAVRDTLLPYGRQWLDEDDIQSVVNTLRSDWLTTGPRISEFEASFATQTDSREAVAVANGTAALHASMFALGIGPGDEVVVPAMTFAATASCVLFQGGTPIIVDVDPETLLIDPRCVADKISSKTKAIIAVDFAGQPCDYDALRQAAAGHNIRIVADACHSLGATFRDRRVGALADFTAFSFHPVKAITAGEGGMVTTNDAPRAQSMRRFRNHGISEEAGTRKDWTYSIEELGYNYRITDFQCALAISQLNKLPKWLVRRAEIAATYDQAFVELASISPLGRLPAISHANHLYVVQLDLERIRTPKSEVFAALRAEGIGVQVHYMPVHLHSLYRQRFGYAPGLCPVAEAAYERLLSLPIFPRMTSRDVDDVITAVAKVVGVFEARA